MKDFVLLQYLIRLCPAAGDREFCVKGKLMDADDKLNLRLRIGQHIGETAIGAQW